MQLTSDNYDVIAAKAYQSVVFSTKEFYQDLALIDNIKADITRYFTLGEHRNLRILINKLITISNLFTFEIAQQLLFFRHKQSEEHISFLKTVYTFLEQMPDILVVSEELVVDNKYIISITTWRDLECVFNTQKKLPFDCRD
jgi:hypothetical protein